MKTEDIINKLAASSLSTVFSGPPGVGKTTTELAMIAKIYEFYPELQFYVATQKYDSWCGLWRVLTGYVVLNGIDFLPLEQQVTHVFNILTKRKLTPPEERGMFQVQPVWLILSDWFATANTLACFRGYKEKAIWENIRAKLGTIITLGREFHCGLIVDTHSFNINSLGIAKDTQIRDCLNLCILGKVSRNDFGMEQGGFEPIAKAISNPTIVSNFLIREQLKKDLIEYQQLSIETDKPLLFTTMGHPPRLMLLPDLRTYQNYELPRSFLDTLRDKLNPKQDLEVFLTQTEQQQPQQNSIPQISEVEESGNQLELNELPAHLKAIIAFYHQRPGWIAARDLRNKAPFKPKGSRSGWTADQIRDAFRELLSQNIGVGKGDGVLLEWALKEQPLT